MNAVPLGEVSDTVMGQAPPGKECNKEGNGTVFVKAGEFSERTPITREWTTKPLKLAKAGDVLVCVVGATAGKVNFGVDCAIGRSVAAVRPKNGRLNSEYLFHFLSNKTPQLRAKSQGLAQGVITREMLANLEVPLPPLDEQKRIAAILDQADALRRLRQRAIDRLNTLGQAIFHEMFGGNRSAELVELKSLGQVKTGSTPSTKVAEYFDGDIPFMTPGDLETDRPVARYLSAAGAEKSRSVVAGSTLVCCIGATIGKTDIANKDCTFNQQINAVEWGDRIRPAYGYYAVRGLRPEIERMGRGASTTLPILKKSLFQELRIPVADQDDQVKFEERIKVVEKHKEMFTSSATCAENLFSSLQSRAFRGEL